MEESTMGEGDGILMRQRRGEVIDMFTGDGLAGQLPKLSQENMVAFQVMANERDKQRPLL